MKIYEKYISLSLTREIQQLYTFEARDEEGAQTSINLDNKIDKKLLSQIKCCLDFSL